MLSMKYTFPSQSGHSKITANHSQLLATDYKGLLGIIEFLEDIDELFTYW